MPLLDCLEFFMGNRYGKFQLVDVGKIELLQIGFGFVNQVGRRQWVLTMESLLYTFNVQCKFMMPCKHEQPPLIVSKHFSHFRGLAEGTFSAVGQLSDLKFQEQDKFGLQVLLHYFSMPGSIDFFFHGKKADELPSELTLATLAFWQKALSDLRRKFFTYSIKPRVLPITGLADGDVPYDSDQLELSVSATHLHDESGIKYQFLLSLAQEKAPFCVLTRYLIFNTVTGCFHLYHFKQLWPTLKHPDTEQFFRFQGGPKLQRQDMRRLVHEYFRYAFGVVGEPRHWSSMHPTQVLSVMMKFWHLTGLAQDTLAICLEVQQLYLYVHLKRGLTRWYEQLPALKGLKHQLHRIGDEHYNSLRDLRKSILYGIDGAKGYELDRVFFVDIVARRLLLWSCIHQFSVLYKNEM
jgi:hypothetical protein